MNIFQIFFLYLSKLVKRLSKAAISFLISFACIMLLICIDISIRLAVEIVQGYYFLIEIQTTIISPEMH